MTREVVVNEGDYEPFFTTRAPLGHGLALTQVYGIVKQHEGHIDVETQVGEGTTFALFWPALPVTESPMRVNSRAAHSSAADRAATR